MNHKILAVSYIFLSILSADIFASDMENGGIRLEDIPLLLDTKTQQDHVVIKSDSIYGVNKFLRKFEWQDPEKSTLNFDANNNSFIIYHCICKRHYYNLVVVFNKTEDEMNIDRFIYVNSEATEKGSFLVERYILADLINMSYGRAIEDGYADEEAFAISQRYKTIPTSSVALGIQLYDNFEDNNCAFYAADIAQAIASALLDYDDVDDLMLKRLLPQFFTEIDGIYHRRSDDELIAWAQQKRADLMAAKNQER